jgi:hypothetical protein
MDAAVVDADGHVLEPFSAFDSVPSAHRLHVTRDSYGLDHVFAGEQEDFWAITDPEIATSLARAYNDWLASYCAADPARLYAAAMVPW